MFALGMISQTDGSQLQRVAPVILQDRTNNTNCQAKRCTHVIRFIYQNNCVFIKIFIVGMFSNMVNNFELPTFSLIFVVVYNDTSICHLLLIMNLLSHYDVDGLIF